MKEAQNNPIKLIVSIIDRGRGSAVMKLYTQEQIFLHFQCPGQGTATSEIMDILGLGTDQKDIILSFGTAQAAGRLLNLLDGDLRSALDTRGIVFSLQLQALNNLAAAVLYTQTQIKTHNGGTHMEQTKNSLILVMVNQGYTDQIMATAKKAGARGGTVVRGRWNGFEDMETAYGLELDSDKEIIAIVVSREQQGDILDALNSAHGLRSEANAVLCSLPIDQLVRFG